jgi:hypothetical protein
VWKSTWLVLKVEINSSNRQSALTPPREPDAIVAGGRERDVIDEEEEVAAPEEEAASVVEEAVAGVVAT